MTIVCTHDIQNIFKYCVVKCGFTFISYLNISVLYTLIVVLGQFSCSVCELMLEKNYQGRTLMEGNSFRIIEQMFLYCDISTHERAKKIIKKRKIFCQLS